METRDAEIETSSKQSSSGSESSDGSDSKRESVEGMKSQRVTEADLNALGAKRLKAELMGNEVPINYGRTYLECFRRETSQAQFSKTPGKV